MKSWPKTCWIIISLVIPLLFWGCGAGHKLVGETIFVDDNFTYNNLKENGLIVGGIATDVIALSRKDRVDYNTTFSKVLLEKLKDVSRIKLITPRQLIESMGSESYFTMMKGFDYEKTLFVEWADAINNKLPKVRYILFAYIVNENIVDVSHDYEIEDPDGEISQETEYEKTYYITVDFLMYDLFQKEIVCENSIFNKAQQTETRTSGTGCVESCLNSIIQAILFGQPAEISREEVFVKIVEKYTEEIARL
jgi:hypothetical protein